MDLREARAVAVQKHLRALEDNWRAALPRLLDELDTIDREHVPDGIVPIAGARLTEEQVTKLRADLAAVKNDPPAVRKPPARRRTTRGSTT